ncbi:pentapeptide repeat-containing protein [Spirillospora sp. NPDC052269]
MGEIAPNGAAGGADRPDAGEGLARKREEAAGLWPIRRSLTVAGVAAVLGLVALMTIVLGTLGFPHVEHSKSLPLAQLLDVLKLVLGTVAGVGALFALVTAYRRQRLAEAAHNLAEAAHEHTQKVAAFQQDHQERLARNAEHDAAERRITELYNAAAEQLDSDKAPVRLTALYTLERLANDNPSHQQTIANIICAYLRMPYSQLGSPEAEQYSETRTDGQHIVGGVTSSDSREEHQVRLTAQRILQTHLYPVSASFWPEIDLDLAGATLIDFNLSGCTLRNANFGAVNFTNGADFRETIFSGLILFDIARFGDYAEFGMARFRGDTSFTGATFSAETSFSGAEFSESVSFSGTAFSDYTGFSEARFGDVASFVGAKFDGTANFYSVKFDGSSFFYEAEFRSTANFNSSRFDSEADFENAEFTGISWFNSVEFNAEISFRDAKFAEHVNMDRAHVLDRNRLCLLPSGWRIEAAEGTAARLVRDGVAGQSGPSGGASA